VPRFRARVPEACDTCGMWSCRGCRPEPAPGPATLSEASAVVSRAIDAADMARGRVRAGGTSQDVVDLDCADAEVRLALKVYEAMCSEAFGPPAPRPPAAERVRADDLAGWCETCKIWSAPRIARGRWRHPRCPERP
jgi:hypothetical protein